MTKRTLPLVAPVLIAAVLFAVVAHACSDLKSIQAMVQPPCDHSAPQEQPAGKPNQESCDSIRFGLLSTQVSPPEGSSSKFYSIALQGAVMVEFSLPDLLSSFSRSHAPPFSGLGATPHLSHVVLRM